MRLRVVLVFGEIIAIFSPTRALSNVDLPAFGRPRIQTKPERNGMLAMVILRRVSQIAGRATHDKRGAAKVHATPIRRPHPSCRKRWRWRTPKHQALRRIDRW